jgi:hypothetical protein
MLLRGLLDLKIPSEGGKGIPDPGSRPENIYNQGFISNLRSIPLSLCRCCDFYSLRNIIWPRSLYPHEKAPPPLSVKEEKKTKKSKGGGKTK